MVVPGCNFIDPRTQHSNVSLQGCRFSYTHYNYVIMGTMASQITGDPIVCLTVSSAADQRKHQRSASLAFVRGRHRWLVNSPQKGPVTRKMFQFDDIISKILNTHCRIQVRSKCRVFMSSNSDLGSVYPCRGWIICIPVSKLNTEPVIRSRFTTLSSKIYGNCSMLIDLTKRLTKESSDISRCSRILIVAISRF